VAHPPYSPLSQFAVLMVFTIIALSSLLSLTVLPLAIETCRVQRFLLLLCLLGAGCLLVGILFGGSVWLLSGDPRAGLSAGFILSALWTTGLGAVGGVSVVRFRRSEAESDA